MALEVLEPGFGTTIQDLGRIGYGSMGIPESGAMDLFALQAANLLVGNEPGAAAIETPCSNFKVRTDRDCLVSCAGPEWVFEINGSRFPGWMAVLARAGDLIQPIPGHGAGRWGYLAVSGGIDVPVVAGSRSTFLRGSFGGLNGRTLQLGDSLNILHNSDPDLNLAGRVFPWEQRMDYKHSMITRVIPGPQKEFFGDEAFDRFTNSTFQIGSRSDRMGYTLEGSLFQRVQSADILSEGVIPGSIQVPADGNPVVLMSDAQTTGGYAKIAAVIRSDLGALAQLNPGDQMSFMEVSLTQARELYLARQHALQDFTSSGAD
jgi:antagonist of KipI